VLRHPCLILFVLLLTMAGLPAHATAQPQTIEPFDCDTPIAASAPVKSMRGGYIVREGNTLRDTAASAQPFKFVSFNISKAILSTHFAQQAESLDATQSDFAQEDLMKSLWQISGGPGSVARTYTLGISQTVGAGRYMHLMRLPVDDTDRDEEVAWAALDRLLCHANKYGVRLIIPLVNFHFEDYLVGGIDDFAALVLPGAPPDRETRARLFYTDPLVRDAFKRFITYTLNRRNTYTNQRYIEDKAILAWQLGNELFNLDTERCWQGGCRDDVTRWVQEMALHIKSFRRADGSAPLVADPRLAFTEGVSTIGSGFNVSDTSRADYWAPEALAAIDIISNHYYKYNTGSDYVRRLRADLDSLPASVRQSKVFMIGEIGLNPPQFGDGLWRLRAGPDGRPGLQELVDAVLADSGTAGLLFWELIPRNAERKSGQGDGGFQARETWPEPSGLRWPGFSQSYSNPQFATAENPRGQDVIREIDLLRLIWRAARAARASTYGGPAQNAAADWGRWDIGADQPRWLLNGAGRNGAQITLIWAGVTGADRYDVIRQQRATNGVWQRAVTVARGIPDGAADGRSLYPGEGRAGFRFVDPRTSTGQTYRYFVRARTPASRPVLSAWSCAVVVTPDGVPSEDCQAQPTSAP
jgi:hypothetical protein